MPKEKRPLSSDDSDSGPEDRAPLPKSQKKSLHKVMLKLGKTHIVFRTIRAYSETSQIIRYQEAPAKPKSSGGASSGGGGASDDKVLIFVH